MAQRQTCQLIIIESLWIHKFIGTWYARNKRANLFGKENFEKAIMSVCRFRFISTLHRKVIKSSTFFGKLNLACPRLIRLIITLYKPYFLCLTLDYSWSSGLFIDFFMINAVFVSETCHVFCNVSSIYILFQYYQRSILFHKETSERIVQRCKL